MTITPLLSRLGIRQMHIDQCKLPLEQEAVELSSAGLDVFDREVLLLPSTLSAWQEMQEAANRAEVTLQIVSGFRSIEYQCDLFERKLKRGIQIEDILKVNAIPGYSEHHTGRALDLTTPGYPPLETEFENSDAFKWLAEHAGEFGFSMSYPKDNKAGIDYEPWHWAFKA